MIRRLRLSLTAIAFAFGAAVSFAQDTLVLSQARLGNVFLSTEAVQIPLQTSAEEVMWTATDFFGVATSGASIPVNGIGNAVVEPGLGRLGYFDLRITALRDGNPVATADTTFAVVAASEVGTMHDSAFGVMTHFAQGWKTEVMQLLARGGIAHFRDEQYWQDVEPVRTTPATYTFADYEGYMAQADALGLKPLPILSFANTNYDAGFTPHTAGGRTGYADYARALLARYGSQIDTVEVWNEYNGSFCSGPATANRPLFYTAMLQETYAAIKAQRPDVRILGGASVPVPLPWFEDLFALGALDSMDAVAVHPYRTIPEGVEAEFAALQELMAAHNHGNGPKQIWATESGVPDPVNRGRQEMARYLVRLFTLLRSVGVERAYWYLARDYNEFTTGLVRSPTDPLGRYAPTSAFPAYANLIRQLHGASFVRREPTDPRTRIYLFRRGATEIRVAWSTAGTAQILIGKSTPLTRVDIMGVNSALPSPEGVIPLTVDGNPIFLVGTVASVREIGRDAFAADTAGDFSATQSTSDGGWFYGVTTEPGGPYNPQNVQPMTFNRGEFEYAWSSPFAFSQLTADGGHPSTNAGQSVWVVRRWLSDVSAKARCRGTAIRNASGGDGTGLRIHVDGSLVYSALVAPSATLEFDFTAPIEVGSKVDFSITPGPGTDISFDYLDFRAHISVPPATPTTFAAWQGQNFTASELTNPTISDDNATPAGDRVPNLLKYAANADLKLSTSASLPVPGVTRIGNEAYLTLTCRRAIAASDLIFTPEINASDLRSGTWTPGGVPLGPPVNNGDGSQTITMRDELPMSAAGPQRFMRLRVSRAPTPPATFSAWRRLHFTPGQIAAPNISGDLASPSGDSVPNLLKYASSIAPTAPGSTTLPQIGMLNISDARYLTLTYRRAKEAIDLIYSVEWNSGDLSAAAWTPGGVPLGAPVNNGDGTESVTVRDETPLTSSAPRRYARLRVSRP